MSVPANDRLSTPAECRQRATECERIAALPGMGMQREGFLSLAAEWRKIANHIEAIARGARR